MENQEIKLELKDNLPFYFRPVQLLCWFIFLGWYLSAGFFLLMGFLYTLFSGSVLGVLEAVPAGLLLWVQLVIMIKVTRFAKSKQNIAYLIVPTLVITLLYILLWKFLP